MGLRTAYTLTQREVLGFPCTRGFEVMHGSLPYECTNVLLLFVLQKTVVAVLNKMVNPYWPYLPERKDKYLSPEEEAGVEGAWNNIPNDPLEYHFYYHILDADERGRPPKIQREEGAGLKANEHFDRNSKSCLHVIAKSSNRVCTAHVTVTHIRKLAYIALR